VSSLIDGIRVSENENLHENFIVVINFECKKETRSKYERRRRRLSEKKIK